MYCRINILENDKNYSLYCVLVTDKILICHLYTRENTLLKPSSDCIMYQLKACEAIV